MTGLPRIPDPFAFAGILWPNVYFYSKQREIIQSVIDNDETFVPAGNMLGKDFVAGFVALWFFLTRHPCRVVTTSASGDHLRVLWGEIMRFVRTSTIPLDAGPGRDGLILNHQNLRKQVNGERCPLSYLTGLVASDGSIAAMQGHHIAQTGDGVPRTLFVSDESSSVEDEYYTMAGTWMNRALVIGNTWPCENFFKRGVKAGDKPRGDRPGHYRKVIRIRATDSPNVRLAHAEIAAGRKPSYRVLVQGVKSYQEYVKNQEMLDEPKKCVILDAEFYEGAEVLLYPPAWLNRAEDLARALDASKAKRQAKAIGIDPAEGGDKTAMCAVDELGIIELVSRKTPDTSVITAEALAFMRQHGVPAEKVVFDRGGGGKEHADRLRAQGYEVQTVAFGESLAMELRRGIVRIDEKREHREERYVYKNRRAEMYGQLRELLDPAAGGSGFAIPAAYTELRRQLGVIPYWLDEEGRLYLPPKHAKAGDKANPNKVTLDKLMGCSPDEADAVVLGVAGMLGKFRRVVAGAV